MRRIFGFALALVAVSGCSFLDQGEQSTQVRLGDRNFSIPSGYFFDGKPAPVEGENEQSALLQFLWPSMEGQTRENASAFDDPYMPVSVVLVTSYQNGNDLDSLEAQWNAYVGRDQTVGEIGESIGSRHLIEQHDRDGPTGISQPEDVHYWVDESGMLTDLVVCRSLSSVGGQLPNPNCEHMYEEGDLHFKVTFLDEFLDDAMSMKASWLSKFHSFEAMND